MSQGYRSPTVSEEPSQIAVESANVAFDTPGDARYGNAAVAEQLNRASKSAPLPRPGAPATKAEALARHRRNCARVDALLRSALAQEVDPAQSHLSRTNLLRNSAQWIQEVAQLQVLSPTHDSHLRPIGDDETAYFDNRQFGLGGAADYGDAHSTDGIEVMFTGQMGGMGSGIMTLVDPMLYSEGDLVETLIHESQHAADQHQSAWLANKDVDGSTTVAQTPYYNLHMSEFRAYWLENPEGGNGDDYSPSSESAPAPVTVTAKSSDPQTQQTFSKTVQTSFANARQHDIFMHMFNERSDGIYFGDDGWTQDYAYLPHFYAFDPAYKQMVDRYTVPTSGNAINSPRIQALSAALSGPDWRIQWDALDDLDRNYLAGPQAEPFWHAAIGPLGPDGALALRNEVRGSVFTGPSVPTVKVVSGDTLFKLADRFLHDGERWPEIFALNDQLTSPDVIVPGATLRMPSQ